MPQDVDIYFSLDIYQQCEVRWNRRNVAAPMKESWIIAVWIQTDQYSITTNLPHVTSRPLQFKAKWLHRVNHPLRTEWKLQPYTYLQRQKKTKTSRIAQEPNKYIVDYIIISRMCNKLQKTNTFRSGEPGFCTNERQFRTSLNLKYVTTEVKIHSGHR